MQGLYKKLRKIDSFGRDLKFEEEGSQSFKTEVGATFSLIMFVSVIVLAILFGREIYERKIPVVLVSNEIVENPRLQLSEFPIILFFTDLYGKNFVNADKYLKVEVDYINFSDNNIYSSKQYIGMLPCNPEDFTLNKEFVVQAIENSKKPDGMTPWCINHNNTFEIQNSWATVNSSSLMISVHACHPANECPPDLRRQIRMMYVGVSYYNSFFNPKNYESPVSYYNDVATKQVSTGLVYDQYIRLSKDEFYSDNGWILQNTKKINAIKVQSIKEDIYPPYHERLTRVIFEMSKRKELVNRNYLKVPELFAKIGGIFNACSIIFNMILYDYILFKFRIKFLNSAMGELKVQNFSKISNYNYKQNSDSSQPQEKNQNAKVKLSQYSNSSDDLNKNNNLNNENQNLQKSNINNFNNNETIGE